MSWHHRPGGERGYHHGNLRQALIEAALALIAERGPAGFTFAEAARQAGVSPAAPYRHFRDRDALLAEVARLGFDKFTGVLDAAWSEGKPNPFAALERVGKAYLTFARKEPAYYSVMFEAALPLDMTAELHLSGERAFGVLRKACEVVAETLPPPKRPPAMMMALHIWSLSHGIAALFGRADGGRRRAPMSAEELLEAGLLVYLQGLGIKAT